MTTTIAAAAEDIRRRARTSGLSIREIARRAKLSDSTIRAFLESGNAQVLTLDRIEVAITAPLNSAVAAGSGNAGQ